MFEEYFFHPHPIHNMLINARGAGGYLLVTSCKPNKKIQVCLQKFYLSLAHFVAVINYFTENLPSFIDNVMGCDGFPPRFVKAYQDVVVICDCIQE